jgi:hypothetical protein
MLRQLLSSLPQIHSIRLCRFPHRIHCVRFPHTWPLLFLTPISTPLPLNLVVQARMMACLASLLQSGSAVSQQADGNDTAGSPSQSDPTTTRETAQALAAIPPTFPSDSGSRVTLASSQNQTIPMEDLRRQTSPRIVPSLFGTLMNSLKHDGSTDAID